MIARIAATLAAAVMATSVAVAADSVQLNPQPLPPKCHPNARCPPNGGGPIMRTAAERPQSHRLHCTIRHHHRICVGHTRRR